MKTRKVTIIIAVVLAAVVLAAAGVYATEFYIELTGKRGSTYDYKVVDRATYQTVTTFSYHPNITYEPRYFEYA